MAYTWCVGCSFNSKPVYCRDAFSHIKITTCNSKEMRFFITLSLWFVCLFVCFIYIYGIESKVSTTLVRIQHSKRTTPIVYTPILSSAFCLVHVISPVQMHFAPNLKVLYFCNRKVNIEIKVYIKKLSLSFLKRTFILQNFWTQLWVENTYINMNIGISIVDKSLMRSLINWKKWYGCAFFFKFDNLWAPAE